MESQTYEDIQIVDVRKCLSRRGYVVSSIIPIDDKNSMAYAYGMTLFSKTKTDRLFEEIVVRLRDHRHLLDFRRFKLPFRAPSETWRNARNLEDFFDNDEFAEHIGDKLMMYDRARNRLQRRPVDLLGQPSKGLMRCTLSALESIEERYAPCWARMNLICVPYGLDIPEGYEIDKRCPPVEGRDMLFYLHRVYAIDRAVEVLPQVYVQTFVDEVLRRSHNTAADIQMLIDSLGRPTIFTLSAGAEALSRGMTRVREILKFMKRYVSEREAEFLQASPSTDIFPGVLESVHRAWCRLCGSTRTFTQDEEHEVLLQAKIRPKEPDVIARILISLHVPQKEQQEPLSITELNGTTLGSLRNAFKSATPPFTALS